MPRISSRPFSEIAAEARADVRSGTVELTPVERHAADLFMCEIRTGAPKCERPDAHSEWQRIENRGEPNERIPCWRCEPA